MVSDVRQRLVTNNYGSTGLFSATMMAAMCVAAIGHVSLSFLPSCLSCMCAWKLYFFPTLAHDGHWSLGGQVQHEPQNLFKILLHHSRKMSESHGGGTAHGAAEDETKL